MAPPRISPTERAAWRDLVEASPAKGKRRK
jgi:hypothetical protein